MRWCLLGALIACLASPVRGDDFETSKVDVEVNVRMMVERILSRYPNKFVMFREMIHPELERRVHVKSFHIRISVRLQDYKHKLEMQLCFSLLTSHQNTYLITYSYAYLGKLNQLCMHAGRWAVRFTLTHRLTSRLPTWSSLCFTISAIISPFL